MKSSECPTAFHTVLGICLFYFGNLLAKEPSLGDLAKTYGRDWSGTPYYYWLSALDVFEAGDNLPNRTGVKGLATTEDWRMSIAWGRTLIRLADEMVSRTGASRSTTIDPRSSRQPLLMEEPKWPKESPFSAIMSRQPPVTRRLQLQAALPHDLMALAWDHLARGMLYMPRSTKPVLPQTCIYDAAALDSLYMTPESSSFCRAKELVTFGSEVLALSQRFDRPTESRRWASCADSIFSQLRGEAKAGKWMVPLALARGKCRLVMGNAMSADLKVSLNNGQSNVLCSEEAQEARDVLVTGTFHLARHLRCSSD